MTNKRDEIDYIILSVLFIMLLVGMCSTSCGYKQEKKTVVTNLEIAQEKGRDIYANIQENTYLSRCDKLTFKALLSVYSPQDIAMHEDNGRWNRDTRGCYPVYSRSTISLDSILSVLHHILTTKDRDMLERLISYGEKHSWVIGEGPKEYTDISIYAPIIYNMRRYALVSDMNVDSILSGFRGHLLASYLWLSLRTDGKLNKLEYEMLNELVEANQADPIYLALLGRITGNQEIAIQSLLNSEEFSKERIGEDGVFGWGSAPASVYYLITLAIIEGK